jgi:hypothetical protein
MKRSLLIGCLSSLAILSGFASCGKPSDVVCGRLPDAGVAPPELADSLTNAAQACSDRNSLGFGLEFKTGTRIGTSPQDSLTIKNGGLADLSIMSVNLSGDSAFKLTTEPAIDTLPAAIKGNKTFFMQVIFTPTEAKAYNAKITVQSNAENFPLKEFTLSGCGIPTDGGTSPCYLDGGM